jgi:3',5'-cyclic AMP phosphodiesterase CpdA
VTATAALAPPLRPPLRLLMQVSDTHFGTEQRPVLEALVQLAAEQRPEVALLTGDITQRARSGQFEAAARFVARLAARHTLVLPGNHDLPLFNLPLRLLAPYAGFRATFGDELEPRLKGEGLWIAGLRSTRRWRHKHGELSATQVRASADFLSQAPPGALRVLATHHPLVALQPSDQVNVVRGAQRALRAWQEAGVHLVMGGHIHLPYFMPLPSTGGTRPLWVAQAGTAVSSRLRPGTRHSVNLLRRAAEGGWRLERWDHEPARGAFGLADWAAL